MWFMNVLVGTFDLTVIIFFQYISLSCVTVINISYRGCVVEYDVIIDLNNYMF